MDYEKNYDNGKTMNQAAQQQRKGTTAVITITEESDTGLSVKMEVEGREDSVAEALAQGALDFIEKILIECNGKKTFESETRGYRNGEVA